MSLNDWIESSLNDLNRAELCFKNNDYECTCFYAQQAVEKILKAYLIKFGNFLKTHDLTKLTNRCLTYGLNLAEFYEDLEKLSIHYSASRYPNARISSGITYNEEIAKWCLDLAVKIINYVLKFIRK